MMLVRNGQYIHLLQQQQQQQRLTGSLCLSAPSAAQQTQIIETTYATSVTGQLT